MYLRKINDSKVQDIPMYGGKKDTRPVKGADIIPEPYPNIFLLGRKKSGKTSTIFHILKNKVGKKTHVTIISGSVYNDANWKSIRAFLDQNGISYDAYESVTIKEGSQRINVLDNLVEELNMKAEEREEEELKKDEKQEGSGTRDTKDIYLDAMIGGSDKKKKEKKEKYLTPEQIIILDDLSTELRNQSVASLIKKNRHYKALVLISSQYLKDLTPATRQNIDVWIIFRGQEMKLLKTVHEDASVPFSFDQFVGMYKKAMEHDRSFFYVNSTYDDYRIRFTHQFN